MTDTSPHPWIYEGKGVMHAPSTFFEKRADARFEVGERYILADFQERSYRSHNHYFASIHEAWMNLPETISFEFPDATALRKRALILTGFRDERSIVTASKAEAQRFAAFIKPMDGFAVVSIHECAVVVWTAKSQSMRAMGEKEFQRSKDAVLGWCWELVGVPAEVGSKEAGKSA